MTTIVKHCGVVTCQIKSLKRFCTNCFCKYVIMIILIRFNLFSMNVVYCFISQAGPLEQVKIARDRDGRQKNFAFITYRHPVSVPYAIFIFKGTALFHKTLNLQCRGRVVPLPPPIRCYGPETPQEIVLSGNEIRCQFADMSSRLEGEDLTTVLTPRGQERHDIVMASLQGNWHNRHHPYRHNNDLRPRERDHRERDRDSRASNHWRDRRNNRRGNYHRRD